MNWHVYSQQIFKENSKNTRWEKEGTSEKNGVGKTENPHRDDLNVDAYLIPYTKKSVQHRLTVKCGTRKYDKWIEENMGGSYIMLVWEMILVFDPKAQATKTKTQDYTKLKCFCAAKRQLTMYRDNLWDG